MPVTYIKGSYRILGSPKSGDSVRFTPIERHAFTKAGIVANMNSLGSVQLRLEAVSALEIRYSPPGGGPPWHQPTSPAGAASAFLLDLLGFDDVGWNAEGNVAATIPDATFGYLLAHTADAHGRVHAMVFTGMRSGSGLDGDQVDLDIPELLRSVNYQLLAAGLVYPSFYSRLPAHVRAVLASAAAAARASRAGIWEHDVSLTGVTLRSRRQLMDETVILPKLFRRLAQYLDRDTRGGVNLASFSSFLNARGDRVMDPPTNLLKPLDSLVDIQGQTVRLTVPPERIIFIEDDLTP